MSRKKRRRRKVVPSSVLACFVILLEITAWIRLAAPTNYVCAVVVRMLSLKYCGFVAFIIVNLFLSIESKGYVNSQILSKATAQVYQLKNSSLLHNIPRSIDYRNKYVTPVKNQGSCGSCWAFSTIEEIESALAFKTGKVPSPLSVEQVLVCCGNDISTCDGCMGGDTVVAYEYLMNRSKGLDYDSDYPYDPHTDPFDPPKCKASEYKAAVKVTGWSYAVPRCSSGNCQNHNHTEKEMQLAAVVAEHGPVSIAMDETPEFSHKYRGGISDGMGCTNGAKDLNHAIQIVGYDLDAGYWLVRNSYGAQWGEDGYFRLQFGSNACGITNEATIVEVEEL